MTASDDITRSFDKIVDFVRMNIDPALGPIDPATGQFVDNWTGHLVTLLYDYVHGHADLIREYLNSGTHAQVRPGTGTIWYKGGLEKAADLIDPYKRESQ